MRKIFVIPIFFISLFIFKSDVFSINMDYACGTVVSEKAIVTVKFNTNGGEKLNDLMYCYDCGVEKFKLPTPKKNGYKFIGWYTNKNLTSSVGLTFSKSEDGKKINYIIDDTGCNSKKMHFNLYAKWEKDEKCPGLVLSKVTVNFETGTDEKLEPMEICASCNDVSVELPTPIAENQIFIGWYLEKELLTKISNNNTSASKIYSEMNLESDNDEECSNKMHGVLYARWIKKEELKYFIIDSVDNNLSIINRRISG